MPYRQWTIELGELDEKMGVEILEQRIERVVLRMPVAGNRQSFGSLHGGASLAVGEAAGSWAANLHASRLGKSAVGVDVSATHHKGAMDGMLTITATPLSLGRSLTSHEVVIEHESGARLCTLRITNMILDRPIPGFELVEEDAAAAAGSGSNSASDVRDAGAAR